MYNSHTDKPGRITIGGFYSFASLLRIPGLPDLGVVSVAVHTRQLGTARINVDVDLATERVKAHILAEGGAVLLCNSTTRKYVKALLTDSLTAQATVPAYTLQKTTELLRDLLVLHRDLHEWREKHF